MKVGRDSARGEPATRELAPIASPIHNCKLHASRRALGLIPAFKRSRIGSALGYAIAAYGIVIGVLAFYGLWTHSQRRKLTRRVERSSGGTGKI